MKTLLLLLAIGCASEQGIERQEEVIQNEEQSRTSQSDEMGPGFIHGTTSSPN